MYYLILLISILSVAYANAGEFKLLWDAPANTANVSGYRVYGFDQDGKKTLLNTSSGTAIAKMEIDKSIKSVEVVSYNKDKESKPSNRVLVPHVFPDDDEELDPPTNLTIEFHIKGKVTIEVPTK